ncbi:MAG: ATP-dependent protease ATPase subunit HslU [Desulfovibrionaceae bacterium]|nr:ATP-dependent protease ATPase subunit HslU [Desulfovibrionaceae bacterium]
MTELTPKEIVELLDAFIVGQEKAKKMVAIALRNRWRAGKMPKEVKEEFNPKNIMMIGPTGVGKTEIARRIAKLSSSPFIKVEATKFTEVGYVGRDVESIIRDLLDIAILQVRSEEKEAIQKEAARIAEERFLDVLLPTEIQTDTSTNTREKLRELWKQGALDDREVEIEVEEQQKTVSDMPTMPGMEMAGKQMQELMSKLFPPKKKMKKVKVPVAFELLQNEVANTLIDEDKIIEIAKERVEHNAIVFIDEIDKTCSTEKSSRGEVSREGVQRDLLPIVEGSSVNTKHGIIKTDHILFIVAGAFHVAKPSDLIPELQGRFPIRVELEALTKEDFYRILVEPKHALTEQYKALLATEDLSISFTDDAIEEIASFAEQVNTKTENIGARRLYTIMEKVLTPLSFNAPDMKGQHIVIDKTYVQEQLRDVQSDEDLQKYIL